MSFLRKAMVMSGGTVATAALGLVQSVLVARALGPDDTGRFRLALSLSVFVVSLLVFGLSQSNVYFLNKRKSDPARIVTNTLWYSAVLGPLASAGLLALFILKPDSTGGYSLPVAAAFAAGLPFMHWLTVTRPILIAQMRAKDYSVSQITARVVLVLPMAGAWFLGWLTIEWALVLVALSQLLASGQMLYYLRGAIRRTLRPDLPLLGSSFRYGLQLYAVNLLTMLDQQIAVLFLGFMLPGEFDQIGFFSRALALCGLIRLVPNSISLLLYSHWSGDDQRSKPEQVERVVRFAMATGVLMAVFVALCGKPLIWILYGKAFLPAYWPLLILVGQQALWVVSRVFQSFFSGRGRPLLASYSLVAANVVSVAGLVVLIPLGSIIGAAVAVTLGQAVCVTMNLVQARAYFGVRPTRCLVVNRADLGFVVDRLRQLLQRRRG